MRESMEQHFNTPAEVIDTNMKAGEGKAHLPLGKMILLGIMAGAFIALGGATSSTAAHAIDNVGLARFVAGIIFPVGLMIIVFVGGELFTGNCLIVMDVVGKKVTWFECIRNLIVVYFSNLIGALIIDTLIYFSGNLDYTGGLLGAYAIKVAVGKVGISPLKGVTSGILCNIPVGMMAAQNPAYVAKAQEAYGLTAEQIQGLTVLHSLNNFIPVTIGNILGGMVFVGIPCFFIYKKKWQKWHEESKTA